MTRARAREDPATRVRRTRETWTSIHAEDSRQPMEWSARLGLGFFERESKARVSRGKHQKTWRDPALLGLAGHGRRGGRCCGLLKGRLNRRQNLSPARVGRCADSALYVLRSLLYYASHGLYTQISACVSPVTPANDTPRDRLRKSFTPHRPIDLPEWFAGRTHLLDRAADAINTSGRHVVLFGERGAGKTSLARVLAVGIQEPEVQTGLRAIVVSCSSADNYSSIWRKVFQEIQVAQRQLGFTQDAAAPVIGRIELPDSTIEDPNDVRLYVRSLPNPSVIVIDEFDRVVGDSDTQRLMADTIKLFSDMGVESTIVVVGVADSVADLIAGHESIARNIAQVQVSPMTIAELRQIVQRGFEYAGLDFEASLDEKIADLSQGYPAYTHLLGLWSGRRTLDGNRSRVTLADLDLAIEDALENATANVQQEYENAVASVRKDNLFREVLLACALAEKDSLGRFAAVNVREPLAQITERDYTTGAFQSHLAKFAEPQRGPVLKKTGSRRNYRWQFLNPQLIPYVRLNGIKSGLLPH
jgi:Cdc6-like AAA superfamily ATPase